MSKQTKLTPVEWEIMEWVWKLGGKVAARDVVKAAYPAGEKAYTTVQTIMNTLHSKGFLQREKIGSVNFFLPTNSRKKMVHAELSHFVSRIFAGSMYSLANFLLNSDDIDLDELETIKALVEKREKELKEQQDD